VGTWRDVAALAGVAAVLAAGAPAALGSFPSASTTKWNPVAGAVFAGRDLVLLVPSTESVFTTRADGRRGPLAFRYHALVALRTALTPARTRFVRPDVTTAVAIRSSIGSMSGARIAAAGDHVVVLAGGAAPPPVVWCCTDAGTEVVVESDGRPGAPVAVAAGIDGDRVRLLVRSGAGTALVSAGPAGLPDPDAPDGTRTAAPFPGTPSRGTSAIAAGLVAWTDAPASGVLRTAVPADTGVTDAREVTLGGTILSVLADPGQVVATVRTGRRVRVLRVVPGGGVATVWSGTRVPHVALGRGTVVVGDRRAVFASRRGPVRRVATARGPVAGVAADLDRGAWFERVTVRVGGEPVRRTRARLVRVLR
jgi:hypothetical protein